MGKWVCLNTSQKTLACYELSLYNQGQTDTLISLLGKVGTLDEIKPDKVVRRTYRVWENKSNGLSYFLSEDGAGQTLTTELIVLNRSTPFGKDWISSRSLDWYKRDQSEPLNEAK